MDFPGDSFDRVVAMYVMSVAPDPVRLMNEMRRVCKPDGELYIVNHFHHPRTVIGGLECLTAPLPRCRTLLRVRNGQACKRCVGRILDHATLEATSNPKK